MMKKIVLFLMLVFLLSMTLGARSVVEVEADQAVIRVPADYPTIQGAIDAANSGDVILVSSGTYHEHLTIAKSLTLIGEDRSNTIIDGDGIKYVIRVTANDVCVDGFTVRRGVVGIFLDDCNGSTISGNIITLNVGSLLGFGIWMGFGTHNTITHNVIAHNSEAGIFFMLASNWQTYDTVYANIISNNSVGILGGCSNNTIYANTISDNRWAGIELVPYGTVSNNTIYHNNFINNYNQVFDNITNFWDNGKGKGNYWSDYVGLDNGAGGRVVGDGVGDTKLPHLGLDQYPLINPWGSIPIIWKNTVYPVKFLSNSTISTPQFNRAQKQISFDVKGPLNTTSFCNITIPKSLLKDNPWTITIDDQPPIDFIPTVNETHTSLYFTCTHPKRTRQVEIQGTWVVPEFPTWASVLLILIVLTAAIAIYNRRLLKTPIH